MKNYQVSLLIVLLLLAAHSTHVFAQHKNRRAACPVIKVQCPDDVDQHTMMLCSASVSGLDDLSSITFTWTVSKGAIKAGKNAASVVIDTTGAFPANIVATVEVRGLRNKSCPHRASAYSVLVISDSAPVMLTEYGDLSFEQGSRHLDMLAQRLRDEPGSRPYIIAYAGRQAYVNEASERAEQAKRYLVEKHGIEADRIVTVDGGYREVRGIELWLEPSGAISSPLATPTLRLAEVQILTGKKP